MEHCSIAAPNCTKLERDRLSVELSKKCSRLFQAPALKVFREPAVDIAEDRPVLAFMVDPDQQAGEAGGRAKFPPFRGLVSRDLNCFSQMLVGTLEVIAH